MRRNIGVPAGAIGNKTKRPGTDGLFFREYLFRLVQLPAAIDARAATFGSHFSCELYCAALPAWSWSAARHCIQRESRSPPLDRLFDNADRARIWVRRDLWTMVRGHFACVPSWRKSDWHVSNYPRVTGRKMIGAQLAGRQTA